MVNSEGALVFFLCFLTGVDVRPGGRTFDGLAVLVLVGGGDLARMVLGCEPVVEVISVLS
jgi:hypothetical protein